MTTTGDPRRRKLLESALNVFGRFGYRKTSMDEVARAAGVSRQGLYLHFSTKEELFRATVEHALGSSLDAASARLADESHTVEARLIEAFGEFIGRFVELIGKGAVDIAEAADELVGPVVVEHEQQFIEHVAKFLRASGILAAYKPAGITARQLADTLYATSRGLKHECSSRAEFSERFAIAARMLCLPLKVPR